MINKQQIGDYTNDYTTKPLSNINHELYSKIDIQQTPQQKHFRAHCKMSLPQMSTYNPINIPQSTHQLQHQNMPIHTTIQPDASTEIANTNELNAKGEQMYANNTTAEYSPTMHENFTVSDDVCNSNNFNELQCVKKEKERKKEKRSKKEKKKEKRKNNLLNFCTKNVQKFNKGKRPLLDSFYEIVKESRIYNLRTDEFEIFSTFVIQYLEKRQYRWVPTTGSIKSDLRVLVYRPKIEFKKQVLENLPQFNMNWVAYLWSLIRHCSQNTATINNPIAYFYSLFKKPSIFCKDSSTISIYDRCKSRNNDVVSGKRDVIAKMINSLANEL